LSLGLTQPHCLSPDKANSCTEHVLLIQCPQPKCTVLAHFLSCTHCLTVLCAGHKGSWANLEVSAVCRPSARTPKNQGSNPLTTQELCWPLLSDVAGLEQTLVVVALIQLLLVPSFLCSPSTLHVTHLLGHQCPSKPWSPPSPQPRHHPLTWARSTLAGLGLPATALAALAAHLGHRRIAETNMSDVPDSTSHRAGRPG
jgi:hypothetical protein